MLLIPSSRSVIIIFNKTRSSADLCITSCYPNPFQLARMLQLTAMQQHISPCKKVRGASLVNKEQKNSDLGKPRLCCQTEGGKRSCWSVSFPATAPDTLDGCRFSNAQSTVPSAAPGRTREPAPPVERDCGLLEFSRALSFLSAFLIIISASANCQVFIKSWRFACREISTYGRGGKNPPVLLTSSVWGPLRTLEMFHITTHHLHCLLQTKEAFWGLHS